MRGAWCFSDFGKSARRLRWALYRRIVELSTKHLICPVLIACAKRMGMENPFRERGAVSWTDGRVSSGSESALVKKTE